jgi:hypothetical protein
MSDHYLWAELKRRRKSENLLASANANVDGGPYLPVRLNRGAAVQLPESDLWCSPQRE